MRMIAWLGEWVNYMLTAWLDEWTRGDRVVRFWGIAWLGDRGRENT